MQQLYATGSLTRNESDKTPPPGRTLRLPAVRAASVGVSPDRLHAVLPHTLYADTPNRASEPDRPLPVRLALLNTPTGRVLTHAVPAGESYFAHTLLNVPETADALLVIQTWGSPLWQRTPPETPGDLPELPYLPVADVLDDPTLNDWLAAAEHRELVEFALAALLGTPPETPIYLGATAEDVARVIYAVTRALPANLLDSFTFSTYEADPLACTARLVGYDCGSDHDLPEACYRRGVGFNTFTGKRSDLKVEVPFARFATDALTKADPTALDELKTTWQRLGLKDPDRFDLVYRLATGTGGLTKTEAEKAVQHPPLADWLSTRPTAVDQLLGWALDDREFANTAFVRVVQPLRQKPDVLAKLAATVREVGLAALTAGDKTRTANAFEVVLPMVAPAKANAVWGELLTRVTDPDQLPWDMRGYLLPRFVRFKQQQKPTADVDPAFARWLDVPAEHLGEFLALELPKGYQLQACRASLRRDGEPNPQITRTLAAHPQLVLKLLQPADGESAAVALYESLLTHAPDRQWFEEVIGRAADYPPALLNRFFETSLATAKLDADRLVRTRGGELIDLFTGQSGLTKLGTQFLSTPPADVLNNQTVLGFLGRLREQDGLGDELKARIDAVLAVRAYLDSPQFTLEATAPVIAAFAVTPPPLPSATRSAVFEAVATELTKRSDSDTFQSDLEAAITHLGDTLAIDQTDMYENLLRDLRTRIPEFGRRTTAVHTFLAVALGATQSPDLAGRLEGLDGHAFAVATDAAKRGGRRLLDAVDSKSKSWPKEAQTKWGFLLAAVRPRSRWQRDLTCVLIGAAAATIGWLAWTFAA